ncbi:MAG: hypothetical protein WCB02_36590, partial [Bradyrhizobium sp.]
PETAFRTNGPLSGGLPGNFNRRAGPRSGRSEIGWQPLPAPPMLRIAVRAAEIQPSQKPITALFEWRARFECEPAPRDELTATVRGGFAGWLESPLAAPGRRVPRATGEAAV